MVLRNRTEANIFWKQNTSHILSTVRLEEILQEKHQL